jgi:catechol 2,3-dioxygenase-like lactoylglutathione lyase family enzyme
MGKAAALKGNPEPALAVLVLAVPDANSAGRFYEAAFGWLVIVREPNYIEFALPNTMRLGLYEKQGFALHTTLAQ